MKNLKMNLDDIKAVFKAMPNCVSWSLQLLKINTSKHRETSYIGRELTLSPKGSLSSLVKEISDRYVDGNKGELNSYHDITEYNGSTVDKVIYRLDIKDKLIENEYISFIDAVSNPDTEFNPLEFDARAYVLQGIVQLCGDKKTVKLISMQNPLKSLKHKFLCLNGTFTEISNKVISLRTLIDVVIIDSTVYMFSLAGENLFNMERAYKANCIEKLNMINKIGILTDFDAFASVAGSGHNPRKFISFNNAHYQKLTDLRNRAKMSTKFNIPMKGDLFDTTKPGVSEKLVKLLCDRAMLEPFDEIPMEVHGSKKWE